MAKPAQRDPSRAALAAAIGEVANAEGDLKAAQDAAEMARDRYWSANRALDEIREAKADAVSAANYAAQFIASVAAGAPCDVAQLESPAAKAAEDEKAAAKAAELWRQTRDSCVAAIVEREETLRRARDRVAVAAREVVRNSDAAAKLMAGLDELQAEVIRRRVALRALVCSDALANRDEINAFLLRKELPGGLGSIEAVEWKFHDEHVAWQRAFEMLTRDADATLPTG